MQVLVTADGATAAVVLPVGQWVIEISATTWDGASVTLQESVSGDSFADSDDPYSKGSALTRTANGNIIGASGGVRYRLNVSSFGASTDGLRLIANPSSR